LVDWTAEEIFLWITEVMFLHYLGKSKLTKSTLKWTKTPNAIRDIIDSNIEKNNEILISFGVNIPDITGH